MSKFGPRVFKSGTINTKDHWAVGIIWKVLASNGKSSYNIEMKDGGFSCDCPAFVKCKHIKMIEERF
tara:strand:- start:98 stop:298 length:201 start_codon:yes stop_codon:yes gene_type:complete